MARILSDAKMFNVFEIKVDKYGHENEMYKVEMIG